jgi:hypothetical protein
MEVKSFGVHISNVAPGDSRPILQGRYHAPIIPGSAYEIPYGNTLKLWMSMSMVAAINEMAEAVYRVIQAKEPKIHYKVGVFYAEVFDRAEAYSSR